MNYREEVRRTLSPEVRSFNSGMALAALGLAGESGEVVDLVKKYLFHGKPLDRDKLILELGDVRWYLESFAIHLGVSVEDIERANIAKLRARFPAGFSHQAANVKADESKPPESVL